MADWHATIAAEWKALAISTLAEIGSANYYTIVEALEQNSISEAIKAINLDPTRTPLPYLFAQIGKESIPTDVGIDSIYYEVSAAFYYLSDGDPVGTLDAPAYCRSRLEVFKAALQVPANLTTCQWQAADGTIDSSEDVAFASSNKQIFAAKLNFDKGFLTRIQ